MGLFDSGYTSYVPGDPQFEAGWANPGALAAAVNAAGQPGTENLDSSSWLDQLGNAVSSPGLAKALQDASKSSVFNPKEPPALGAAAIPTGKVGDPAHPLKLDALVQLLQKQRAQYGAMSGQPVAQQQVLGLLGF